MRTCFVIMPFGPEFDRVEDAIRTAATSCGMECLRGDGLRKPGGVIAQVIQAIRRAAAVVADVTGNNPNVLYELGIAHQMLGPERVVILAQDSKAAPYDIQEFRHLNYAESLEGREKLAKELPHFLKAVANYQAEDEVWSVIRGELTRTRLIIRDLNALIDGAKNNRLDGVTIRITAGLGSLAISDYEPPDESVAPEYREALVAERNALRKALVMGARLKAVLNPPTEFKQSFGPDRLTVRFKRLIGLVEGKSDIPSNSEGAGLDLKAIRNCEIVLNSVPMSNLWIIDDRVAYEGSKRKLGRGFERTRCETNAAAIDDLIKQFEETFEKCKQDMLQAFPPDGRLLEQLKLRLRRAENSKKRTRPDSGNTQTKSIGSKKVEPARSAKAKPTRNKVKPDRSRKTKPAPSPRRRRRKK
jgi:hypothetical protein